jgi:hypothetical protein
VKTVIHKSKETQERTNTARPGSQPSNSVTPQFVNNRPEAAVQRRLQEIANNSPRIKQTIQLKATSAPYQLTRVEYDSSGQKLGDFEHGLQRPSRKRKYRKHVEKVKGILAGADERMNLNGWILFLHREIKGRLAKSTVKVPEIKVLYEKDHDFSSVFTNVQHQKTAFVNEDWTICVNGESFERMDGAQIDDLANSVYHEARHAEQAYWGAWYEQRDGKPGVYSSIIKHSVLQVIKMRQIFERIKKSRPTPRLDVKLALGKSSSVSFENFKNRKNEDQTREAYRNDFHEKDARATAPWPEIDEFEEDGDNFSGVSSINSGDADRKTDWPDDNPFAPKHKS